MTFVQMCMHVAVLSWQSMYQSYKKAKISLRSAQFLFDAFCFCCSMVDNGIVKYIVTQQNVGECMWRFMTVFVEYMIVMLGFYF
jgi:hypothetical protein